MYGKTAMTCFKYHVFLYGSEATHLFECYNLLIESMDTLKRYFFS
jgi:hypothetical protein